MAKSRVQKSGVVQARIRSALEAGRFDEAWSLSRDGLARAPKDGTVLNLAGIAAFQVGDAETARELLAEAATRRPKDPEIQMNLGNVLGSLGDTDEALAAYATAAALAARYAEPAYNAGMLLSNCGRATEAVEQFEAALARDPEHTGASLAMAESLRTLGYLNGAKDVLAGLIARLPDHAVALTNLSAVLGEMGRHKEAMEAAERAIAADPGLAAAHYNAGVHALSLDDAPTAIERFRHALGLEPENAAAALNLGEAALRSGDKAGAERAFRRAREIDPTFAKAAVNDADLALADGDAEDAVARIDSFLARYPGEPSALAFKAFALRDAGRNAEATEIDSLERFLSVVDVDAPPGFGDIGDFNRALSAHILSHPTLTAAPASHATKDGLHSGELLAGDAGPIADFEKIVRSAFVGYARRFAGEPSHPFLDRKPSDIRVSVWSVVMESGGHQVPHIHPSAWLSGVYYVEVPDTVRDDDAMQAGWIEFGRAPADIHVSSTAPTQTFLPKPGRMILFPSHFYHRTLPLAGKKRRISVAFDFMARS